VLVRKKTASAFYEILDGSFDRVLVLMAGGAEECRIVIGGMAGLGGVLVASDVADVISMDPIELDDLFGGSKKTGPGFVGTKMVWIKSLKGSLKRRKLWDVADGVLEA
jgi:hypothetical protein